MTALEQSGIKKLGFGFMRLPLVNGNFEQIDQKTLCAMVDHFLKKGFRYFDTAWFYHNGQSEAAIRDCLVSRCPRSAFLLADKMPLVLIREERELEEYFQTQLTRCGVDYFDFYLLHDMGKDRLETAERTRAFAFLRRKKAEGLARKIGFSFHDTADVLDTLLTEHPEVDFVQLQLNYLDWESRSIQSRRCYETAQRHGKPVIVMEPVKGGTLANIPEKAGERFHACRPEMSAASWAIRFAASLENVMMVLSGMSTLQQVEDNTSYMENFSPLSQQERSVVQEVTGIINDSVTIPCTGCSYCTNGCPMNIAIPQYFSLYNAEMRELEDKPWTAQLMLYGHLSGQFGKASACVGCGSCEEMCPQHLPIREWLKAVARKFENG